MKYSVLGTGNVAQTISTKLISLGHTVVLGSRDANHVKANEFVRTQSGKVKVATFTDSAKYASVIFNCVSGMGTMQALKLAGEENLQGKTLIDLANPLDFSNGFPPTLAVCNTISLGEQIQAAYPEVNVVKTLNTMWCGLMVNPELIGNGNHNVFMCGNSIDAKQLVSELLITFGWKPEMILDLGDITAARATEMYLPLWLQLYGNQKTGAFNIAVVK